MSSTIDDNDCALGGYDSKDYNTKAEKEATAVGNDGAVEPVREVPDVQCNQTNDVCSKQGDQLLHTKHTVNETKASDTEVSSDVYVAHTDATDQHTNSADQSEKDRDIPVNNTEESQAETTYFGPPKTRSTSDIVLEVPSSLNEVHTTIIHNSIKTADKLDEKSDIPTQTLSEGLSTSQQHSNGLSLPENVQQPNKSHHLRGILKTTKSEPLTVISEQVERLKHSDSTGLIDTGRPTWPKYGKRNLFSVSTSANYFRTSQEFVNPAFELDENIPSDSKLSDIVNLVMKQQSDRGRYVHPFGQSNMYSSVLLDNTPTTIQNTERVVFWLIFVFMLVGLAGAIIIMSEMYRLDLLESNALDNTTVSS